MELGLGLRVEDGVGVRVGHEVRVDG